VGMLLGAEDLRSRGRLRATSTHFTQDPTVYTRAFGSVASLERVNGLRATVRRLRDRAVPMAEAQATPTWVVTASAMDHEGIIHALTDVVRGHGGNILELETSTESAPMTGSPLFAMRMVITVAERHGSPARLREALETLARAEAIDLDVREALALGEALH